MSMLARERIARAAIAAAGDSGAWLRRLSLVAAVGVAACGGGGSDRVTGNAAAPPPVTAAPVPAPAPTPAQSPAPAPTPTPAPAPVPDAALPAGGYAFLRQVNDEHWNWMFPLRSGRVNPEGDARNRPPIAQADGSTDVFTLAAFKQAVLAYNRWAQSTGRPQFLNEGSLKQQGEEFLLFLAKSARETSGSWSGAPAPWIVPYMSGRGETTQVWKGALYWVEEVGYSTNPDGTSAAVNYVVPNHPTWPAAPGRSYYGRGMIQLSWNYNYGAFSAWLFDNAILPDVVTRRDLLLWRPDLVATNGTLSILSGIWFWMTAQGNKPASHDVALGRAPAPGVAGGVPALPALRSGFTVNGLSVPPSASGDTTDLEVFAYRLGTIVNIVNGGIECNGAAAYHAGPPQRASYYNAFAMYFNDRIPDLHANRLPLATGIWDAQIGAASGSQVQSATCFNQRSYG
ncbi:hypothetical protein HZ992_12505 [Rhizobacter sp. AJA081-3]|uniref:chitinase n=1 Tax=Rhizobacter sp. AJA081-3 TaxID=2753607 RepID=UPI001AE05081|nr:chitinase [Rhizobacter sp. AJA081-3]QTN25717.1 hypothetical protein HZ992_12505 [Rhizobacter sp. AJA081-3]